MDRFFSNIYKHLSQNRISLFVYLLVLVVFIVFFGSKLKFNEDISAIIPNDDRINNINLVLNQSEFADQIILHFTAKDTSLVVPDSLLYYANKIAEPLAKDTNYVEQVLVSVSGNVYSELHDFFYNSLPFYLSDSDYETLKERVSTEGIETSLRKDFKSLISPTGFATRKYIFKDPLNIVPLALKRLENFQVDDNFQLYQSSVFTKDKKHLLVFIDPVFPASNTAENTFLIEKMDSILAQELSEYSIVDAEYYGGTAVAVANASVIKNDIIYTVSIAAIALLIFFFILFRQIKIFFLMFIPVVLGAGVALAILYLYKGEISAIALGIGAVLMGISVDYSLHFFAHLRDSKSIKIQLKELPEPIIMSSITTASAFLCLAVVKSEALKELGLFAAISVFASAFFVLTVLPVLIPKKMYTGKQKQYKSTIFDKIAGYSFESNKWLVGAVVLLTILFFFTSRNIRFNADISTLNYLSDELAVAEKNLEAISSETMSAVYLISSGNDLNEALAKTERLDSVFRIAADKKLFANKSSASDLVLSREKQEERIQKWNSFWAEQDKERIKSDMVSKGELTHFKTGAFSQFYDLIEKDFEPISEDGFELVASNFLRNYIHHKDSTVSIISILKVDQEKKEEFFSYFDNNDEVIIFDRQYFTNSFFEVLRSEFGKLVTLSLIIVFLVLLIFFGRIEIAIITFIPIILSWVWTLGLMGVFRLEFNIFNVIISTFIFGLGVDYCIFTVRGLLNNHKYGNRSLQPFRLSILLSAITTILGIGVLVFARHPALKSIAVVSVFGIVSVVSIAYILLPTMFKFLVQTKKGQRYEWVTLISFITSLGTLIVMVVGSILMLVLLPLVVIAPIKRKRKKYIFHVLIRAVYYYIIYRYPSVRKRKIDFDKLDFSKPSVIISNHQSILDLGFLLMLNPKIIVLTNKWVWNSPIFGFLVRYAEYYPAFQGVEGNVDHLENKVKDGYSILIFPEGTRTSTGEINRFHQGAFYLADKLNLEIQPILLHGLNHSMGKNEFFIHRGTISMKILDRFSVRKVKEGESYREQTKEVTAMYRDKFKQISLELETPDYYARHLLNQFFYKGPVLEWYLRIKLRLEKNYNFFNDQIPRDASITDIGCGYGFLPLMLKMVSNDRTIHGIDFDEEKINVAKQVAKKYSELSFTTGDAIQLELSQSDVFIMADILHYMPQAMQKELIEKCMSKLNEGGKIIIRDADSDLGERTKITKRTEYFSTRFFGFNKTQFKELTYTSGSVLMEIAKENNFKVDKYENEKNTSNISFVFTKQ